MKMTVTRRDYRRWFMRLLELAIPVSMMLAASAANAGNISCNAMTKGGNVLAAGTNPFPRDAPTGSTSASFATTVGFHCQRDPCCDRDIDVVFRASPSALVPGYSDVFPTDVTGVGVRYTISNGPGTSCGRAPQTMTGGTNWLRCHQMNGPNSPGVDYKVSLSAQFVKLGVFKSDALTTIPAVTVTLTKNNQSGTTQLGTYFTGASGSFVSLVCSVRQPAIHLAMPAATSGQLGSVGETTGATTFAVALDCDPDVRVAMTLMDATTPSNRSCTLSLATDSTARGVGYQIMFGGQVVCFGPDSPNPFTANQFFVSEALTSGGLLSVPFVVRYIRTGDINSGSANALATFTMSYQ